MFVVACGKNHSVLLSAVSCTDLCTPAYLALVFMILPSQGASLCCFLPSLGRIIESFSLEKALQITEV